MRLIIKGRAQGKTVELIHASEVTGYPIVAHTECHREHIKEMAKGMNCIIPEPYIVRELTSPEWRRGRLKPEQCLVDDAELIIGEALKSYLGVEVIAATLTDQLKENKKIYEQTSKKEAD